MKELLLLRHAKSSWAEPGQDDFERPLNKRGRRAAAHMATWLAIQGLQPKLVLCSSARRTRETLDLLHAALGARVPMNIEPGLYLADAATLLARLQRVDATVPSVLVIAHNPGLQELACDLANAPGATDPATRARLRQKFPTAALALFRLKLTNWHHLSSATGDGMVKLLSLVSPSDLPAD
jgi:phosphohistidine phosphatase